jgi:hypothetical protein
MSVVEAFTRLIETLGVGKYCHFADSRPFFAEDSKEVLDLIEGW